MATWKPKTSWRDKLNDDKDLPKVVELTGKAAKHWGKGTMLIARPRDVDARSITGS